MAPIHPIPSGTRDVLPDEMRELRAITDAMREVFLGHGYGEVWTPAIEYEAEIRMAGERGVYRLADDHGSVLMLRSDLTVPIARVASTRYANVEPPLRFCSFAHVYRQVKPHRGQMREFLQAGVELIGAPAPGGTVEVLKVLCAALDATGLRDYRIGLGDAALYTQLCDERGVPPEVRAQLLEALLARDFVALASLTDDETLVAVPQRRGGLEVLEDLGPPGERLRAVHEGLGEELAQRVILDLGLIRDLDYYTGAVFDVYEPSEGTPLGGGGRYDDLLGRFGRALPAVGFAIGLDALHGALAGEERGER
ncbi:MAG TPA: ATP phosphoribosyltransferase regulatory subunit [Solirubrobacteraceae bacterium]